MAASGPLPVTQDLSTLRATLQGLLRFLREALSISNAHTVDFYTESVWEQLVDLPPDVVLATLKRSASEAEAPPSDGRLLLETKRGSGERRAGGAGAGVGLVGGSSPRRSVSEAQMGRKRGGSRCAAGRAEAGAGAEAGNGLSASLLGPWVLVYFYSLRE